MSLDINAYSKIKLTDSQSNVDWFQDLSWKYDAFGLIDDKYFEIEIEHEYELERLAPLVVGEYEVSNHSEKYWFRAGSYRYFYEWRDIFGGFCEELAKIVDQGDEKKPPFYYQIEFNAIEGAIGSFACSVLYENYIAFEKLISEKALGLSEPDDFMGLYQKFKECFRIGSIEGVVLLC